MRQPACFAHKRRTTSTRHSRGVGLVELMIALTLGLVVTGVVFALFLTSRQSLRAVENLTRLHDDARMSFELMARELREAGAIVCSNRNVANVLNNAGTVWWSPGSDWANSTLVGYSGTSAGPIPFGTAAEERVRETDAILVRRASASAVTVIKHNPTSAQFKVNTTAHGIRDGDILLVCDDQSAAIFQATNANETNSTIVHNTGAGSPGNCTKDLGYPAQCSGNRKERSFAAGSVLARYQSAFWYIGNAPAAGRRSLYRNENDDIQEMARNVTNLQVEYLLSNRATPPILASTYVSADEVTNWGDVVAVRLTLTYVTDENVSADGVGVSRTASYVISLRNREFLP